MHMLRTGWLEGLDKGVSSLTNTDWLLGPADGAFGHQLSG
jgi:hypothetical protein